MERPFLLTHEDFATRLIDTPFVPFGRDYGGIDCWGCIYLGYRDVLGIDLPAYAERYEAPEARQEIAELISGELGPWQKQDKPKPMDVALMRVGGALCHVGLIVGKRRMLHSLSGTGTCIEDYSGLRWQRRIEGFYRHVG